MVPGICKRCNKNCFVVAKSKNIDNNGCCGRCSHHVANIRSQKKHFLPARLRTRLYIAVRNKQKTGSAVKDLGCSIDELYVYLESKFQPGMTWDNHGDWHIDHIKPLSSFDLENYEELKVACHFSNLQPLWAADNLKKSNK